jgi:hypothetical protein
MEKQLGRGSRKDLKEEKKMSVTRSRSMSSGAERAYLVVIRPKVVEARELAKGISADSRGRTWKEFVGGVNL